MPYVRWMKKAMTPAITTCHISFWRMRMPSPVRALR